MKHITLALLLISILCGSAAAEVFHSAAPGNLSPEEQGVLYHDTGKTFIGWFLDNWTATTTGAHLGSPKFADINNDGVDEIILPTYDGFLFGWNGGGIQLPGFPLSLNGVAPGTPAIGDIDNDGDLEIVQGTWSNINVFNADGSPYPGWPITGYCSQAVTLADLDEDGDLEIIVPSQQQLKVYQHNGTTMTGFPVTVTNRLCAVSAGDLDSDGDLEIVSGSFYPSGSTSDSVYAWHHNGTRVAGFPVGTAGSVKAAPVLADLDMNGDMEVIADCWNQSGTDFLYVWDHQGSLEPGWPVNAAYIRLSSPSVADIDNDGDLEIIVGGWSTSPVGEVVNVFHHTGAMLTNFPVILAQSPSGNVNSTPTVGDIDGDGYPEIVLKAKNNVYALNRDGSVVTGFPVFLDDLNHSGTTIGSPALGDPDGDGLVEIFAVGAFQNVMLIDMNGAYDQTMMFWPSYRNDRMNRGLYGELFTPALTLRLTPVNPPVNIPAGGGIFGYTARIENTTGNAIFFDAWTMALLPNGGMYGPVLLRTGLNAPGGAVLSRALTQTVPGNAPPGNYSYMGFVGTYPDSVIDSDQFGFVKLAGEAVESGYTSWDVSGWEDPSALELPAEFVLGEPCPNPFNPVTSIDFALPEPCQVSLILYNIEGKKAAVLVEGMMPAGRHSVIFDGAGLSSGIYFARLSAPGFSSVKRLLLMK